MPHWLLEGHVKQMPRLKAEEMLDRVTTTALGSGSMKKAAHQRLMRQLSRQARGNRKTRKATRSDLARVGIAHG